MQIVACSLITDYGYLQCNQDILAHGPNQCNSPGRAPMTAQKPKAKAAAANKDVLASAAAAVRRELGLANGSGKAAAKPGSPAPVIRIYEDHVAARNAKMPVRPAQVGRCWGSL